MESVVVLCWIKIAIYIYILNVGFHVVPPKELIIIMCTTPSRYIRISVAVHSYSPGIDSSHVALQLALKTESVFPQCNNYGYMYVSIDPSALPSSYVQ